jgi:hypothetical protein
MKMVPCSKSQLFEGPVPFLAPKWPMMSLVPFKGPKKSQAPPKVLILYQDHLESLKWPHNGPPHLQHRDINSYKGSVQQESRQVWSTISSRHLYEAC